MNAAFTAGQWVAKRCGPASPRRWNVTADLGETKYGNPLIRTIDQVLDYCGAEEAEANAHLIAAAPDLYEALDELIELVRPNVYPQPDKPDSPYGKLERARLAILKARGEQ